MKLEITYSKKINKKEKEIRYCIENIDDNMLGYFNLYKTLEKNCSDIKVDSFEHIILIRDIAREDEVGKFLKEDGNCNSIYMSWKILKGEDDENN